MIQEHKDFLVENINNWHTAQNGYVRNLDMALLKMYEHIYKTYLDANFVLTHWCGGCKMEMITRLYKYYESLPTENRKFTITAEPENSMSNMWCMPCKVLPNKKNGVTIAECYGPLNELALPLRRAVRAHPGETSITQAPIGSTYSVGTIIPKQ